MGESLLAIFERVRANADTEKAGAEIGPHGVRFFAIDLCEQCGCEVEGVESTGWLSVVGWSRADYMEAAGGFVVNLPEVGACEALGGIAVCPGCYRDEE